MNLTLLTNSKQKKDSLFQDLSEYTKRFSHHWHFNAIILPPKKNSNTGEDTRLLPLIPPKSYVIALDEKGQLMNSPLFSQKLQAVQYENKAVCFLIGGADGLPPECLKRANLKLSLSPMTFPHHLASLLLVEQLYRAWSIQNKHPYHRV